MVVEYLYVCVVVIFFLGWGGERAGVKQSVRAYVFRGRENVTYKSGSSMPSL